MTESLRTRADWKRQILRGAKPPDGVNADAEVEETKSIAPGVEVDYDSNGRVLSIEFLNAGKKYDLKGDEQEEPDPYFSLRAAGELFGISPTTLRHQIEKKILRGTKFGRNWMVHRDDLYDYMQNRSRKAQKLRGK